MTSIISQRNIFLSLTLLLSLSLVFLSLFLLTKKERIILVPLTGSSFWIENSNASSTYLENLGSFLSDLLLNRSPADVDWKNKTLIQYVHPSFYHDIQKRLHQDRTSIIKEDQSFVFRPERSFVNPKLMTFTIEGELMVFVTKSGEKPLCSQREKKRYILGFSCHNAKPTLISLKKEDI